MLNLLTPVLLCLVGIIALGTGLRWGQRRFNLLDDTEQQVGRQLALSWSPPHLRVRSRRLSSPQFVSLSRTSLKG